ncbi:MAG: asparagine--tRNA ligase [Kiritimatiellae bacterium]|nr:asparagine--tRNA ligase [Kiritimatiellia bacterium]
MQRTRIRALLSSPPAGADVTAAGWVRTRRDAKGGFSFIELNDGSCLANLQVVAGQDLPNYAGDVQRLHPGAAIVVEGPLVASPGKEQNVELRARTLRVLGFCDPLAYPLGKQRIGLDRLRELPHLRARTNTFGAMSRVRNRLAQAVHEFFQSRGFVLMHTPIIATSDCEGAGEMFQVTTLDLDNLPHLDRGGVDYTHDFFSRRTSLTVSGQIEGETYACALGDVYTFGPTFRAENSNTRRHLAEFWMVEPEMAFADLQDDAVVAEAMLKHLFGTVLRDCAEDLAFFEQRVAPGVVARLQRLADKPFAAMEYSEAVAQLQRADCAFEHAPVWGTDLKAEHERYLTEKVTGGEPLVVLNYPAEIKAFYMRLNDDGRTVAAMDILLPGVGEIVGGSQREERLEPLLAAMHARGLNPDDYAHYVDLRRFGSVPHAGFGMGFERLVQFCTGLSNIRDVIPYPRTPRGSE